MSSESFTSPTSCSITTAVSNFSKSVVALFMIVGILFTANTAAADLVGLEVADVEFDGESVPVVDELGEAGGGLLLSLHPFPQLGYSTATTTTVSNRIFLCIPFLLYST